MSEHVLESRRWPLVGLALLAGLILALALDRAAGPANAQAEDVRLSARQLLINQRISQAGVRRANEALSLLGPVRPANGTVAGWPTETIRDGAVTTAKISAGAVGAAQIAEGAVSAGKIAGGAVATAQVADGAITGPKLAGGAVGLRHLGHELQAEVAGPPFAALNADGSIQSVAGGGPRMSRVMELGTGRQGVGSYSVQFAADPRACALIATLELTAAVDGDAGEIAVKEIGGVGVINGEFQFFSKVAVQTRASDGTPADRPFHVTAIC